MKQSPKMQSIQDNMVSGKLGLYRFLGDDTRNLIDILLEDEVTVTRENLSHQKIADRLQYFTEIGKAMLGCPVLVDGVFEVITEESKGTIPCPFRDNHQADKCVVKVKNLSQGTTVLWTELNVHMIEAHGFYEGQGADFRVDPSEAITVLEILGGE